MGKIRPVAPVTLLCALLVADRELLAPLTETLIAKFGRLSRESPVLRFDFTSYYREAMGAELWRRFLVFADRVDPAELADIKLRTNGIEVQFAAARRETGPRRPVNIDPGYLTPGKLVLASTKDFSHRVYLRDGIFAEVTLGFGREGCRFFPWTFPDYRSEAYGAFLLAARKDVLAADRVGTHGAS